MRSGKQQTSIEAHKGSAYHIPPSLCGVVRRCYRSVLRRFLGLSQQCGCGSEYVYEHRCFIRITVRIRGGTRGGRCFAAALYFVHCSDVRLLPLSLVSIACYRWSRPNIIFPLVGSKEIAIQNNFEGAVILVQGEWRSTLSSNNRGGDGGGKVLAARVRCTCYYKRIELLSCLLMV